jgi:hypothetical protein
MVNERSDLNSIQGLSMEFAEEETAWGWDDRINGLSFES